MIAIGDTDGPDWEERMWLLTHDLVVAHATADAFSMIEPRGAVADCIVVASTAVAAYRAVVERYPEGFA